MYGELPRPIVLATARDPLRAALFNHASMALNSQLFINGISKEGPTEMPSTLAEKLKEDFGSIEILRDEMLAMAHAMFGPGFVWLVRTQLKSDTLQQFSSRKFRLLCTYLAGSPLAGAHNRAQPIDMNTQYVEAAKAAGGFQGLSNEEYARQTMIQNKVGTAGAYSAEPKNARTSFGGVHITPVLCVNTWQHAWLPDHGVLGKYSFLEKWWDLIDWRIVDDISGTNIPEQKSHDRGGGSFIHT
ncbi:manganese and iron superoxide dismutase [Venturia nashicola]|uniref:Manganese and iron superoxide dismutase n=1 Tax=Venturia nashicola TaxID=86259 RepID=A0A4Z1PNV4_9PEZI|nr:manganese and iron superoxide dismutase [Venturia nashicola]